MAHHYGKCQYERLIVRAEQRSASSLLLEVGLLLLLQLQLQLRVAGCRRAASLRLRLQLLGAQRLVDERRADRLLLWKRLLLLLGIGLGKLNVVRLWHKQVAFPFAGASYMNCVS